MAKKYVIALDQGTTSSRTLVIDQAGGIVAVAQKEYPQIFPEPGWVEHNPMDIWSSQASTLVEAVSNAGIDSGDVAAIGITNQRETTIVWDVVTGKPIYNAIVWQDGRTAEYCKWLAERGLTDMVRSKTGLILNPYFSATKIRWILENVPGARAKAEAGELRFGTVDSWLVWNLTGGRVHVTDVTNASRTLLFNIHTLQWDKELLDLFKVPDSMLPQVRSCSEVYGKTELIGNEVPIAGIAGDQQAALFGQMCTEPGMLKNTYGTGCFLLMNTGSQAVTSRHNLLTTVAWKIGETVNYALEGSVFVGGSVIQWLRDGLGIVDTSPETEEMAMSLHDNGGVYFVPALTGLGAPYWDPDAKGLIVGITRGTTAAHIARAALEGIAFQTMDIVEAMKQDAGLKLCSLAVDGGASRNNYLMQFQADILGARVVRPTCVETTAMGAAYLAGLAVGFWDDIAQIRSQWSVDRCFEPVGSTEEIGALKACWADAVARSRGR